MNNYDKIMKNMIGYYRFLLSCTLVVIILISIITFEITKSYYEGELKTCKVAKDNFATCCINRRSK